MKILYALLVACLLLPACTVMTSTQASTEHENYADSVLVVQETLPMEDSTYRVETSVKVYERFGGIRNVEVLITDYGVPKTDISQVLSQQRRDVDPTYKKLTNKRK